MDAKYHYEIKEGKLIFTDIPEGKDFIAKLTAAFSGVHFRIADYDDLWMNDEISLHATTDNGDFRIYRDAAGYYSINPVSIDLNLLDELLKESSNFYKT